MNSGSASEERPPQDQRHVGVSQKEGGSVDLAMLADCSH